MNTKNFTSLATSLFLSLILASCNVLQTITGGETDVNFKGKNNGGGFERSFVMFTDGGSYYSLNASTGYVTTLGPYPSATDFTVYGDNIFFSFSSNLYRHNLLTETTTTVGSFGSTPFALAVHDGKLFFVDGAELCYINSPGETSITCTSSAAFGMVMWMQHDHASGKLISCYNGAWAEIDYNTESYVLITPGGTADTACSSNKYYHDGLFAKVSSGTVTTYDAYANTTNDVAASAGSLLNMSGDEFYFSSSSLEAINLRSGFSTLSDAYPTLNAVANMGDWIYYVESPSGDEVFRSQKWTVGSRQQVTSLGTTAYFLASGPGVVYLFHGGGIEEIYSDGTSQNINSMGVLASGYQVIYSQ